jgi:hypothetical protein
MQHLPQRSGGMTSTPALRLNALSEDELKHLASKTGPCLSIVQPLSTDHIRPDAPARSVQDSLNRADRPLNENQCGDSLREELLRLIRELAESANWARLNGSLVAFCAPRAPVMTIWPQLLAPRLHYGDEFFLLPLLPWLQTDHDFWLLGLGEKTVRLFRGSEQGLIETELPPSVPRSLADAGQMDTPDRMLQARSSSGRSAGALRRLPFSTATTREKEQRWMHDFFRAIDRGIRPVLQERGLPLIVAAVRRELAVYREVNSYEGILTASIHGNPDAVGREFLHGMALALMHALTETEKSRAFAERAEAAATSRFVTKSDSILSAAQAGMIEKLFIPDALPALDPRSVVINKAIVGTWRHSGEVVIVAANGPEDAPGALLRAGYFPASANTAERGPVLAPV